MYWGWPSPPKGHPRLKLNPYSILCMHIASWKNHHDVRRRVVKITRDGGRMKKR